MRAIYFVSLTLASVLICSSLSALAAPVLAAPDTSEGDISVTGIDPLFLGNVPQNGDLSLTFVATDADGSDNLSISIISIVGTLLPGQAGFDQSFPVNSPGSTSPNSVSLTGTAAAPGLIELTVSVSDGLLFDLYTFTLTILGNNAAPLLGAPSATGDMQITGIGPLYLATVSAGQDLGVQFGASDANGDDILTTTVTVIGGDLLGIDIGFNETFPFAPTGSTSPHTIGLSGIGLNVGLVILEILVTDDAGGVALATLEITILPAGAPLLQLDGVLQTFFAPGVGQPSDEQSYTCSGIALTGNVTITPPSQFEISLTSGSGFTSGAINLPVIAGILVNTEVFVRYAPGVPGPHSGAIVHISLGALSISLNVSGTVLGTTDIALVPAVNVQREVAPGKSVHALKVRFGDNSGGAGQLISQISVDVRSRQGRPQDIGAVESVALVWKGKTEGVIGNGDPGWTQNGDTATVTFSGLAMQLSSSEVSAMDVHLGISDDAPVQNQSVELETLIDPADINSGVGITGSLIVGEPIVVTQHEDPLDDPLPYNGCVAATDTRGAIVFLVLALLGVARLARRKRVSQ